MVYLRCLTKLGCVNFCVLCSKVPLYGESVLLVWVGNYWGGSLWLVSRGGFRKHDLHTDRPASLFSYCNWSLCDFVV